MAISKNGRDAWRPISKKCKPFFLKTGWQYTWLSSFKGWWVFYQIKVEYDHLINFKKLDTYILETIIKIELFGGFTVFKNQLLKKLNVSNMTYITCSIISRRPGEWRNYQIRRVQTNARRISLVLDGPGLSWNFPR
jgi:hypothetical protein